jgi:hypothetical protein
MRYFTPDRYVALQNFSGETAMDAADAAWAEAVHQYDAYLATIAPNLPEPVRRLIEGFHLHDARVLSISQQGNHFVVCLQLDVPPNDLLTITYTLAGPPEVNKRAFSTPGGKHPPLWECEEIEMINKADKRFFAHDVLLSNGWVLRIPFQDVQIQQTEPIYPVRAAHPDAVAV